MKFGTLTNLTVEKKCNQQNFNVKMQGGIKLLQVKSFLTL